MTLLTPFRSASLIDRLFDSYDEDAPLVHSPEIRVKKGKKDYRILAKVPGAKKDNIKVEVDNGYLKISGKYENKREEKEEGEYQSIHSEFRSYSEFQRAISLDSSRFEVDKIDATLENGVLEVVLPLTKESEAKLISVKGE